MSLKFVIFNLLVIFAVAKIHAAPGPAEDLSPNEVKPAGWVPYNGIYEDDICDSHQCHGKCREMGFRRGECRSGICYCCY